MVVSDPCVVTTRSSNPSAVTPKYVRARSSAMTRLSPPSPAGKEWLTTPTIVKYAAPFWGTTGSSDPSVRPAAGGRAAAARVLRGGVDPSTALGRARDPLRHEPERGRLGDARDVGDRPFHLVVLRH